MRALATTFSLKSIAIQLPALIVEPDAITETTPILLFLHGKGEAGSSANELPMVCLHQSPPFQAFLGRLPEPIIVAPQAPPTPGTDEWNWRSYATSLAEYLSTRFDGRTILAIGFSRGGLGVLQLAAAQPGLFAKWAVIDPQPTSDHSEAASITSRAGLEDRGWIRYGTYRNRNDSWKQFSSLLLDNIPDRHKDTVELSHGELALQAFEGVKLSTNPDKTNLYAFLGLTYEHSLSGKGTW